MGAVKHRTKKKIIEKSTYMAKKLEFVLKQEEIRREFPGELKLARKANCNSMMYDVSKEQTEWLLNNVGKKYSLNSVSEALGVSIPFIYRALSEYDEHYRECYQRLKEQQSAVKRKARMRQYEELRQMLERNKAKKEQAAANEKKKKEKKEEPAVKKWAWDKDEEKRKKKLAAQARKEEKKRKAEEKEDERKNRECYEKLKGRERKPIPFSEEEKALRKAAYDSYYILPDGEELLSDRRKCIYWDEDTKRKKWIEEEADRLKFNVIEYRKMFRDTSNHSTSCTGGVDIIKMYQ